MRFSSLLVETLSLTSLVSASVIKRQAVSQVYKFSSPVSAEGIAVRSNGELIVSFFDGSAIYTVDPATKKATNIGSLTGVTCSAAITEVSPDIFAVVGGKYSGGRNTAGSWAVWKLDFTGATPKISQVKQVAESGMWNGITTLNNDTVLVADALKGSIFKVSISTGESSVVIQDATMAPPSGMPMGIDGVKLYNGTLYFTNIFKNSFYKVPIDAVTAKTTGTITPIWTNIQGDDMAMGPDGSLYVATSGKITKVGADGKPATFATVAGATAAAIGRGETDKNTLYVTQNNGGISAVKLA
jgi:sugar lactone lactonase YvrE